VHRRCIRCARQKAEFGGEKSAGGPKDLDRVEGLRGRVAEGVMDAAGNGADGVDAGAGEPGPSVGCGAEGRRVEALPKAEVAGVVLDLAKGVGRLEGLGGGLPGW
jgi:hypothetical protein